MFSLQPNGCPLSNASTAKTLRRRWVCLSTALSFLIAGFASAQTTHTSYQFDFGPGKVAPGYTQVLPTTVYSPEAGYGFEPGANIIGDDREGGDALRSDFCTSNKPFYFSVSPPEEGNYRVTVTLGDLKGKTSTTVKAELRRLMLEKVETEPGKVETRQFIVNIRRPQISTGGKVRLKPREKAEGSWAWDNRLTLKFNGEHSSGLRAGNRQS